MHQLFQISAGFAHAKRVQTEYAINYKIGSIYNGQGYPHVRYKDNLYNLVGELTIKDITRPIKFQANVDINGLNFSAQSKIKIDRTKWDITYKSGNYIKDFDIYIQPSRSEGLGFALLEACLLYTSDAADE